MIKRMIIMLVAVALVLGLVFGFQAFKGVMTGKAMAGMATAPVTVATTTATTQDWQPEATTVGSLRAINGADLSLDIAGVVDQINFNSGDEVKAGTALMRLRPEDDPAKLEALRAAARLAEITLNRDQQQLKAEAIAQAVVDTDEANLRSAKAQVAQQEALIEKKTLRAPFDGRIGIRLVDVGQYLAAGTAIVTLQQLDPIYADFYLPEQQLAILKAGAKVDLKADAYPGKTFVGTIIAIDPKVDTQSRNVQVRARFENGDRKLIPGMYAKVSVDRGASERLVTVPAAAVTYNPYGSTLYIVDGIKGNPDKDGVYKDDKGQPAQFGVHQTFVTTGQARGDQIAIVKGVKDGDVVVVSGQVKLRAGVKVVVNNKVLPASDATHNTPDN
jgi:membrane fusion protein (multidrug efflux system)